MSNEVIVNEFPCMRLKYCPYGPLVEDFPLLEEEDDESCPIFGHQCPAFFVAEPFFVARYEEDTFA